MKYRRRYKCPACGHSGKSNNKMRTNPEKKCPKCEVWFLMQEQNETGVYEDGNKLVNKWEDMI